jgi:hypothetical protein
MNGLRTDSIGQIFGGTGGTVVWIPHSTHATVLLVNTIGILKFGGTWYGGIAHHDEKAAAFSLLMGPQFS